MALFKTINCSAALSSDKRAWSALVIISEAQLQRIEAL